MSGAFIEYIISILFTIYLFLILIYLIIILFRFLLIYFYCYIIINALNVIFVSSIRF